MVEPNTLFYLHKMDEIFRKMTTKCRNSLCIVKKKTSTTLSVTHYKKTNHTPPHPHTSDSVRSGFGSNESEGDLVILSGEGGRGNVVKDFG